MRIRIIVKKGNDKYFEVPLPGHRCSKILIICAVSQRDPEESVRIFPSPLLACTVLSPKDEQRDGGSPRPKRDHSHRQSRKSAEHLRVDYRMHVDFG